MRSLASLVLLAPLTVLAGTSWSCASSRRDAADSAAPASGGGDGAMEAVGDTQAGAGTTIYLRNSLVPIAPASPDATISFVTSELGLTTVEQLDVSEAGDVRATAVAPASVIPPTCHVPIALGGVDANGDGVTDVLVMDTCAGNWLSLGGLGGSRQSVTAQTLLGGLPPFESFAVLQSPDGSELFAGLFPGSQLTTTRRSPADASWSTLVNREVPDMSASLPATGTLLITSALNSQVTGQTLLLQGQSRLFSIDASALAQADGAISDFKTLVARSVHAPYLVPFSAFDHLTALNVAGCPPAALGVGLFPPESGAIPRQLQLLSLTDTDFDVQEQATPFDVITFVVVPSPDGTAVIGAIGHSAVGDTFAVLRATGCGALQQVVSIPTDFDWREPEAPAFGENGPTVPRTDGVTLAASADQLGQTFNFWHYDGYDLRRWIFTDGQVQATKTRVHDTRSDLAFQ